MDPARRLIERRENSLLSLFELSHELGVGLDPYSIAELALFNLMGHFGTTAAAMWLLPEARHADLVLLRGFGIPDEKARRAGPDLAGWFENHVASAPGAIRVGDGRSEGAATAAPAGELGLAILAPITAHGRLVGLMGLGPRVTDDAYGPIDLEYVSTAAGMVGVALENARLYHQARESNRRLRETNERLAELDRLKSQFVANVNHELRTPLAVIIGCHEVMAAILTDARVRDTLAMAQASANKLKSLLVNVLDFSSLEESALALSLEPCDLGELLLAFAEERRAGIANGLREFRCEIESGLPRVTCEPRRVLQIVGELVDNAVKFTSPGSRIRLRVERCGDRDSWIEIGVEDDGPGIPADRLKALFEPFRQGDGSLTREAGGMGLGLTLSRRLAEAMGGTLEASSEPGVGSRFLFRLRSA